MTMSTENLDAAMERVGLFAPGSNSARVVSVYQMIHGLKVDGVAGPVVERHLARQRFCGNHDRLRAGLHGAAAMCRWDATTWDGSKFVGAPQTVKLNYFVAQAAPGLTLDETRISVARSFTEIAKHAAILWSPIDTDNGANLVVAFNRIDGPQGILAQTELPCGRDDPSRRLSFEADNSEVWTISLPPQGKLYLDAVLTHEFLHACGLEHLPEGNLMAPFYNANISTMQAGDIQQLQLRYGPAQTAPPQPPAPPVPSPNAAICTVVLPGGQTLYGSLNPSSS